MKNTLARDMAGRRTEPVLLVGDRARAPHGWSGPRAGRLLRLAMLPSAHTCDFVSGRFCAASFQGSRLLLKRELIVNIFPLLTLVFLFFSHHQKNGGKTTGH